MMLPVLSALLAFAAGLFRSRASLCLAHLSLLSSALGQEPGSRSAAPPKALSSCRCALVVPGR